jgi:hypothetical protein
MRLVFVTHNIACEEFITHKMRVATYDKLGQPDIIRGTR